MIRGISFQVPQGVIDTLWQIFQPLNVTEYQWYNDERQYEVFPDEQNEDLFETDYYSGVDFLTRIQRKHLILFLKLQAYFPDGLFFDIRTYDEFLNSDCQILFLIYDCEWVEIYIKDKCVTDLLYKNAIDKGFKDILYITDENDRRTRMEI